MARGRRGRGASGSAARIANIMTGGQYQAAVERGKKSATGKKLKERRKKMTDEVDSIIEAAEEQWKKESGEYGAAKGSKNRNWLSGLLTLASFIPGLGQYANMMRLGALATQGYGAYKQNQYTDDFFKEHIGKFISEEDQAKYKNTFLEDYIETGAKEIEEAWGSQKQALKNATTSGFMTNAMLTLATMGMGGGGGKPNQPSGGGGGGGGGGTNLASSNNSWFKNWIGKNFIDPNTGAFNLNAGAVQPGSTYTGNFNMNAGGPAYGRTQVTPGQNSLGVRMGYQTPGVVGFNAQGPPVNPAIAGGGGGSNLSSASGFTPGMYKGKPLAWAKDWLIGADSYELEQRVKAMMGATGAAWMPGIKPELDPYNVTSFANALRAGRPSWLQGFSQGYWG